ncbi:MAG: DUF3179 domain-containing protein [Calditrichaeota bacterium]|nr:MAG: DUF3179 domain-containing protein [Calditrichota bacterium]
MIKFFFIFGLGLFLFLVVGCSSASEQESLFGSDPNVQEDGDKILIIDRTGKEWDITHAVNVYGMNPDDFQFGLGPDAIRPILNPQHTQPGDPGHPDGNQTFLVIGTTINGDTRAYPIFVLKSHEIVDEQFGDTHVAVAY